MKTYQELFNIVGMYLARICNKTNSVSDKQEVYLDMLAFFVFCLAIKDYLINDDTIVINDKKTVLEHFVKSDDNLKYCKAIANLTKHLTYRPGYLKNGNIEVSGPDYHQDVLIQGSKGIETFRYSVSTDDEQEGEITRDVIEIAYKSFYAWEAFFNKYGLVYDHIDIPKPKFTYYKTLVAKLSADGLVKIKNQ